MDQTLNLLITYKYLVLLPAAIAEGPIVSLIAGYLIFMGYLSFWPSLGILVLGDLIPDIFYYYVGYLGDAKGRVQKFLAKSKIFSNNYALIERLWREHPRKTMFLSKLAYGLSIPFLITAGLSKMPLRKFIELTVPVSIFQYVLIIGIGYLLGGSYAVAVPYIRDAGIVVAVVLVICIAGYAYFVHLARAKIISMEKSLEKQQQPPLE